jgi:hypothetical protein
LTESIEHVVLPEFKLLANVHFGEGTHLSLRTTSQVVQIVPTLWSRDSFFLNSALIAAAVSVLWVLGYRPQAFREPAGDVIPYLAVAGLLICFVKLSIDILRFMYLRSCSPLLAYDGATVSVHIRRQKNPIPRSAVRCLAFVTLRAIDGEFQSEIQLITDNDQLQSAHFICSVTTQSVKRQHGFMLREFSRLTGIPVWVVDSFSMPDGHSPAVSNIEAIMTS